MRSIIIRESLVFLFLISALFFSIAPARAIAPLPPALNTPGNNTNVLGTVIPFRWYASSGANDYYLQVARDSSFSATIFAGWVGNTSGVDLNGFNDNGQIYYWRMAARGPQGTGNLSATRYFGNGPSGPPLSPALIDPINGKRVIGTTVSFSWGVAPRAIDYLLQIATDPGFTQNLNSNWVGNFNSVSINSFLDDGLPYYWRMGTRNSLGSSSFSATQNFVNYPSAPPATPAQTAPASGANVSGTTILFGWSIPARANGFILHVAKDPGFTQLTLNQTVPYATGLNLCCFSDSGTTYYWRVAATNAAGTGPYSFTRTVTNVPSAVPATPALNAPANSAKASGTTVTFSWLPADRASNYSLQIARDAGFSNMLSTQATGNVTSFNSSGFPDNGQIYYWRVSASNSRGSGPYSATRAFTNGPSAVPAVPTLLSPTNGSKNSGMTIAFRWSSARALTSTFQLATDPGFTKLIYNGSVAHATGIDLNNLPDNGQTLYWRVAGNNSLGSSSLSTAFGVINGPSTIPAIPMLSAPANGATVSGYEIIFRWNPTARARDYYLEVAENPGFTNPVFAQWVYDQNSMIVSPFYETGQLIYWRVRARNSLGTGTVSGTWGFTSEAVCTASTVGSGMGVLTSKSHIDTCTANTQQYLKDISRRANNNPHGHNGRMAANATISTVYEGLGLNFDSDNVWDRPAQRSSVDAQVYTGVVYDYWLSKFGLNGFDNLGSLMLSIVDSSDPAVCSGGNTAAWNIRTGRVTYCFESSGLSSAGALDIAGHEWSHGLTARAGANFIYEKESGALDEAFSDWMGAAIQSGYGQANWTIGEGIISPFRRSMSDPSLSQTPQPDTYGQGPNWIPTAGCTPSSSNDKCGVHRNNGVPNKMFYLLSAGGTFRSVPVRSIGIDKAIQIAARANIDKRWPINATFADARAGMIDRAQLLYGANSLEVNQVMNAWAAVNVGTLHTITATPQTVAGGTITGAGSYTLGIAVSLKATPKAGYSFTNWTEYGAVVSTSAIYSFTANSSRSLVANFKQP